ncbi:MAG: hypothetical protein ACOX8W_01350 [bacterium]
MAKQCVLEDKECIECGECDRCDLDPTKICDNCCRCLEGADYAGIQVDEIILDGKTTGRNESPKQKLLKIKYQGKLAKILPGRDKE